VTHGRASRRGARAAARQGFSLKGLKHLVLDEADRLLNMDFEAEIDQILRVIPRERRTQLFSATMTSKARPRALLLAPCRSCVRQGRPLLSGVLALLAGLRGWFVHLPASCPSRAPAHRQPSRVSPAPGSTGAVRGVRSQKRGLPRFYMGRRWSYGFYGLMGSAADPAS